MTPKRPAHDEIMFAANGQFTSLQQPVTVQGTPVTSPEGLIVRDWVSAGMVTPGATGNPSLVTIWPSGERFSDPSRV